MRPTVNRWAATALAASLTGLLAALPAASASASASMASAPASAVRRLAPSTLAAPSVLPTYEVVEWLSGSELSQLLSGLRIGGASAPVSAEALAKALAGLPALQALNISDLTEALQQTLEGLGPEATLQLLQKPEALVSTLEQTITSLLSPTELTELLGRLLGGKSLSEELEGALATVSPSEVLGALLAGSGSPGTLLTGLLGSLPAGSLQGALGGSLEGGAAVEEVVRELAEELQTTPEALATQVGMTAAQLPSTATAITTPLSNGNLLGVLEGTDGAVLGTLKTVLPTKEEGSGSGSGTGEGSGTGTGGATGGSGAGSTGGGATGSGASGTAAPATSSSQTGGSTLIVNMPSAVATHATAAAHRHGRHHPHGIRVLRHTMRRGVLRLLLSAPGAGRITVGGGMVRRMHRHVGRTRRLWLRVHLSKSGLAALRRMRAHARRHRRGHARSRRTPWLRLRILFNPRHGRRSRALVAMRL